MLHPGKRPPFAHRHREAEEVSVVLRGSGRVKLDDEIREVGPLDALGHEYGGNVTDACVVRDTRALIGHDGR